MAKKTKSTKKISVKPKIVKKIIKEDSKTSISTIKNYEIRYEEGELDGSHPITRVFVVDEQEIRLSKIGDLGIKCGFGISRNSAVDDFIKRNDDRILNKIFDIKRKTDKFWGM